jgi:hypothetical protein
LTASVGLINCVPRVDEATLLRCIIFSGRESEVGQSRQIDLRGGSAIHPIASGKRTLRHLRFVPIASLRTAAMGVLMLTLDVIHLAQAFDIGDADGRQDE